jgi:hypothetical protein
MSQEKQARGEDITTDVPDLTSTPLAEVLRSDDPRIKAAADAAARQVVQRPNDQGC